MFDLSSDLEAHKDKLKPFMTDSEPSKASPKNNNKVPYIGAVRSDEKTPYKTLQDLPFLTNDRRNNDLLRVAKALTKSGFQRDEIEQTLAIIDSSPIPSPETLELPEHISSIIGQATNRERNLSEEVRAWVTLQEGYWNLTEAKQTLQILTKGEKAHLDVIIHRLKKDGIIEKYGKQAGVYRRLDNEIEPLDWKNADTSPFDLRWPFGIEHLVSVYPGNLAVIAGAPNAGKTSFMLNFIRLNQKSHDVHLFSSEGGKEELRQRISKFDLPLDDWTFSAWDRSGDFADVVKPDKINVIDYLELHDDFFKVGGMLKGISDRLENGFALIALQKNSGRDEGLGGARGLEKPRLYMAMDSGRLKIVKGKSWADRGNNPNGQAVRFKLVDGCKFIIESKWEREA